MTATAQPAPSRAEINRLNAKKSTGPRTAAGKERVKFNALKHGLRARTLVLPGEDGEAFDARLDAWIAAMQPRDEVERFLVHRAVQASWQLDRVERARAARRDAARFADADRTAREAEEVAALGRRLFFIPSGPTCLYPHPTPPGDEPQRVSDSGDPDDPDDPARLVVRLESTALGCAWLLDRWAELRGLLEDGLLWQPPDRLKAVRMLGRQPLEAVDDRRILAIYLSCWIMDPEDANGFGDLHAELAPKERMGYLDRLNARDPMAGMTEDPAAARSSLLALIVEEEGRLEEALALHLERADAELAAELAFDDSTWGERLRKYELANDKTLLRIIETLRKRHSQDEASPPGGRASVPAGLAPISTPVASFVESPSEPEPARAEARPAGDGAGESSDLVQVSTDCPAVAEPDHDAPPSPTTESSSPAERIARYASGILAALALIVLLCSATLSPSSPARPEAGVGVNPAHSIRDCGGRCAEPSLPVGRDPGGLTIPWPIA